MIKLFEEEYKSDLERELDLWRGECLDVTLQCVRDSNYKALEEIKQTYALAREMHTLEYFKNREVLYPIYYKIKMENVQ